MTNAPWFVDSAPGQSAGNIVKCGGLIPSVGLAASPFVITTPTGSPDRATLAPGSSPTLAPDAQTRALQLGFAPNKKRPYFDGNTFLRNLGINVSNSPNFSLSCWLWPDNTQNGCILSSPITSAGQGFYVAPVGVGPLFTGGDPMEGGGIGMSIFTANFPPSDVGYYVTAGDPNIPASPDYTANYSNAFYHLMIGIQSAAHSGGGNSMHLTVYVNDTAVLTNFDMNHGGTTDSGYSFPFSSLIDGAGGKGGGPLGIAPTPNEWRLGNQSYTKNTSSQNNSPSLQCVATEWWIAPGHYVDWTSGTNRSKFHTKDSTNSQWVPVNIGAKGQTMGFTPAVYCTGGPDMFRINRATGKLLGMQGGSSDTTFIPGYGEVQNMQSDDRAPGGS